MIEKHEIRRKREAGLAGARRGQEAAALDAAGAALGALGLLAFAVTFSSLIETRAAAAFICASLAWLVVSVAAWWARRKWRSVPRGRNQQEIGISPYDFHGLWNQAGIHSQNHRSSFGRYR